MRTPTSAPTQLNQQMSWYVDPTLAAATPEHFGPSQSSRHIR
jgi:hypothetical protein